jgi:hypothetical protein
MAAALSTLSDKTHIFAKKHPGVDPAQQRRGENLKSTANRSRTKWRPCVIDYLTCDATRKILILEVPSVLCKYHRVLTDSSYHIDSLRLHTQNIISRHGYHPTVKVFNHVPHEHQPLATNNMHRPALNTKLFTLNIGMEDNSIDRRTLP